MGHLAVTGSAYGVQICEPVRRALPSLDTIERRLETDVSEDRSWIVATILDIEATRGEFEAAALAASPNDLAAAMGLLDEEIARALQRRRDLLGYRAHLLEQYPALGGGQG